MINRITIDVPQPYNKIGDGPEAPEVKTVAKKLNDKLRGLTLKHIHTGIRAKKVGIIPYSSIVSEVTSYGKKVIIKLANSYSVVVSLGMTGRLQFTKGKHSHVEFVLMDQKYIMSFMYFDDMRYMGNVRLMSKEETHNYLDTLGPEAMAIDKEQWLSRWRLSKYKNKVICEALLDQSIFSGIGNYLRADILYLSCIHPQRRIYELSDEDLFIIWKCTQEIIEASYKAGGFTIKDFISPDGQFGGYKALIYGRTTDDKGNRVHILKIGGRSMYYCPQYQRL